MTAKTTEPAHKPDRNFNFGSSPLLTTIREAHLTITCARFGLQPLPVVRRPVFISGVPRSGTTILGSILDLAINDNEGTLAESFALDHIHDRSNQHFKDKALEHLGGDTQQVAMFNFLLSRAEGDDVAAVDMCHAYFRLAASLLRQSQIIEKTPSDILFCEDIVHAFPDAAFLFCIRHPLQVYVSFRELLKRESINQGSDTSWLQKSPQDFADFYKFYCDKCFELIKRGFNILVVRYEDICNSSSETLAKVLHHTGCADANKHLLKIGSSITELFQPRSYDLGLMLDDDSSQKIELITRSSSNWLGYR